MVHFWNYNKPMKLKLAKFWLFRELDGRVHEKFCIVPTTLTFLSEFSFTRFISESLYSSWGYNIVLKLPLQSAYLLNKFVSLLVRRYTIRTIRLPLI